MCGQSRSVGRTGAWAGWVCGRMGAERHSAVCGLGQVLGAWKI